MNISERLDFRSVPEPNSGCFLWTAATDPNGYGRIRVRGKTELAHRISYEQTHGYIPNGLNVLHKCDNPSCINPKHLFVGTHADNVKDKMSKCRQPKGENHYRSVLDRNKVIEIRHMWETSGKTQREIGSIYGVTQMTISSLLHGQSWKGVK